MKCIRLLVFVAALISPFVTHGQVASESVVRDLTALKDQMHKAERERNTDFLQQLYADEFVAGTSQGDVLDKAQLLARVKSPDHTYDELHSDDVQVRVYGNVAIMTDHTTVRGTDKGHPFGGDLRFVRIFVKKHGKWQIVLGQGTPLRQEAIPSK
jgi:ketosteroid isomerase-like protein